MDDLRRLQEYARWIARENSAETRSVPPFTLYRGNTPDSGWSAAIPHSGATPHRPALDELRGALGSVNGAISIDFFEELFPDLPSALQAAGCATPRQVPLMACSPAMLRMPPAVPGLIIDTVTNTSPLTQVQVALDVNAQGFDPGYSGHATVEEAEQFRRTLAVARAFVARLDGIAVAGGMYQALHAGITRLDGIATIERYRGRGIAAALSAAMTQAAFAGGVALAYLSAANAVAERVYARIGYRRIGT
ncbi:MAG TPA: GNAT family N-acetyltransferase, partial [Thermomicrobiaceae bacterium]|nr:GNAT family N-acetyltransferase [Thermomicrobiaceae bacterium]